VVWQRKFLLTGVDAIVDNTYRSDDIAVDSTGGITGMVLQKIYPYKMYVHRGSRIECVEDRVTARIILAPSLESIDMYVKWTGVIDDISHIHMMEYRSGAQLRLSLSPLSTEEETPQEMAGAEAENVVEAVQQQVASATTDAAAAEQHPPPEPAEIAESVEPPPKRRKSCPVHKKRWEVCGCPQ